MKALDQLVFAAVSIVAGDVEQCLSDRQRGPQSVLTHATDLGYEHRDIAALYDVLSQDAAVGSA